MKRILLGVLVLLATGCATIMSGGGKDNVRIDSDPQGADVYVEKVHDGEVVSKQLAGQTPAVLNISRKKEKVAIVLEKDGYKSESVFLQSEMNPMFFGNILIGGLIGSSTDTSTGAINKYDPSSYFVRLKPTESTE